MAKFRKIDISKNSDDMIKANDIAKRWELHQKVNKKELEYLSKVAIEIEKQRLK